MNRLVKQNIQDESGRMFSCGVYKHDDLLNSFGNCSIHDFGVLALQSVGNMSLLSNSCMMQNDNVEGFERNIVEFVKTIEDVSKEN